MNTLFRIQILTEYRPDKTWLICPSKTLLGTENMTLFFLSLNVVSELFSTKTHDQSEFINKMYIVCNLTSSFSQWFFLQEEIPWREEPDCP